MQVKNAEFSFPDPHWDGVSDEAKDFISKVYVTGCAHAEFPAARVVVQLIVVDVEERLSMEDVVAHPWLADAAP